MPQSSSDLPELISKWDEVDAMLVRLRMELTRSRIDGLVTIHLGPDGVPDVRGMGSVDSPIKAIAYLYIASQFLRGLPSSEELKDAINEVMDRAVRVGQEAGVWNGHFLPTEHSERNH